MLNWIAKHPRATPDMLGYIPHWLSEGNPYSAASQLDLAYGHGGGWQPFTGFTMLPNGNLAYPGDPETCLLFEAQLRDETVRFYEHEWVAVVQPDGSFEVCRMD